jgi:hypothetical protein
MNALSYQAHDFLPTNWDLNSPSVIKELFNSGDNYDPRLYALSSGSNHSSRR